ncbi:MAG: tetratricopeptide repeat protein [Chloroflexota bacterium]|nr:tetratricopeptide repeat protein [Chloroflexota bacterium]
MTAVSGTRSRSLPFRALAIVGCMVAVVAVTQFGAALRTAPATKPIQQDLAPLVPNVGDLDVGSAANQSHADEVALINGDIAFWSARFQAHPTDFVSATQWGLREIDLGRTSGDVTAYLRAEAAFDAALRTFADNPAAISYKGSVLISLHRFADARDLAKGVLVRQPNDPVALATLGDASLELGDVATAQASYEHVNVLVPSAATLVRLAHLAFVKGDTTTAVTDARAAAPLSAQEGAQGERAAWYQFQLGETLIATGDAAAAAGAYRAAIAADPNSYWAHSGLSRALAGSGDLKGAISEVTAAIGIVPLPDFLARRGDLYMLRHGPGDAAKAQRDYALVEAEAKLAGAASYVYDRTLVLYLANHGLDPARALSLATAELAIRKDVYGYDAYAWALLAAGRPADADAAMNTALAFGTKDAKLMYHAGMIAAALGDKGRARTSLQAALTLDPSFDPLQAQRARKTLAGL